MKVVQLGPYPPPHGGVQTNLVAIREYLLRRGIACPVINLTRFRSQTQEDVYYPANAIEVVSLLVRVRGDINLSITPSANLRRALERHQDLINSLTARGLLRR